MKSTWSDLKNRPAFGLGILLLCCLLLSTQSYAGSSDSTFLTVSFEMKSKELRDILRLQNIEYFTVTSRDTSLRDKHFKLVSKEYRNGKLKATRDYYTETDYPEAFTFGKKDSVFRFKVMCHQPEKKQTHFMVAFDRLSLNPRFASRNTNLYSLRDALNSGDEPVLVPLHKPFPLFVYSLPYVDPKKPDLYQYCALTQDSVPPSEWGKTYGVKHYIVFELEITE